MPAAQKRRFEAVAAVEDEGSPEYDAGDDSVSNGARCKLPKIEDPELPSETSCESDTSSVVPQRSCSQRVRFDDVTVYYFSRSQGYSCIPSCGGVTLGMTAEHHAVRRLSLSEHEQEQVCAESSNGRIHKNHVGKPQQCEDDEGGGEGEEEVDEEDEDGEDEDKGGEEDEEATEESTGDEGGAGEEDVADAVKDDDSALINNGLPSTSAATDEQYYLQPICARTRRALLKASGVQVDSDERLDCQSIRVSRQTCGCNCSGVCNPQTCACAKDEIKCQVDRPWFPCGCTKSDCGNPNGRVEFNALRVRTHFLQTMMRLKAVERQQRRLNGDSCSSSDCSPLPVHIRYDGPAEQSYCDSPSSLPAFASPSSGLAAAANSNYWHFDAALHERADNANGAANYCNQQQHQSPHSEYGAGASYLMPLPSTSYSATDSPVFGLNSTHDGRNYDRDRLANAAYAFGTFVTDSACARSAESLLTARIEQSHNAITADVVSYPLSSLYTHQKSRFAADIPSAITASGPLLNGDATSTSDVNGHHRHQQEHYPQGLFIGNLTADSNNSQRVSSSGDFCNGNPAFAYF